MTQEKSLTPDASVAAISPVARHMASKDLTPTVSGSLDCEDPSAPLKAAELVESGTPRACHVVPHPQPLLFSV